jgi:predicted Zn-dependent protease
MESIPEKFLNNPQFLRYYEVWCENEASIVFVPLAQMLRDGGYLQEASEICEKSLKHHPDSISGRLLLASIYWNLDRKEKADRLAREILERMPDHPEAIQYLQTGSGPVKNLGDPMYTETMVDILVEQGAYGDAAEVLRQLIKGNPGNRLLRHRLTEIEEMLSGEEKTVS